MRDEYLSLSFIESSFKKSAAPDAVVDGNWLGVAREVCLAVFIVAAIFCASTHQAHAPAR